VSKLNQSDFAKKINKTRGYVTQLKQAGRLVFADDGLVEVEASIQRIADTSDANRDDVVQRHAAERGEAPQKKEKSKTEVTFSEARAKEQHFKSLQAELDYKKAIGEVVLVADMKAAVSDVVTTFRQALENMPHRVAAQLVGKDLDFIRSTIKQEAVHVLAEMERNFDEKLKGRVE